VTVLVATRQVPPKAAAGHVFYGEVSLKGEMLPTPVVISVAIAPDCFSPLADRIDGLFFPLSERLDG
jgi:hypothetical protein